MREPNILAEKLAGFPGRSPLYLRAARLDVTYTSGFAEHGDDAEHRKTVDSAVREVQAALRLGFFAWGSFPARTAATLKTDWSKPGRLGLVLSADGVHHNVFVALLRLVLGLHHTPLAARRELERIIGEDAATLSPRAVFVDIVERIELSAMEGLDSRLAERPDWTSYVCDAEIARPAGADLLSDADERIVVRGPGLSDFPPSGLARIENRFLQVCGSSLFREIERLDDSIDDEAEIFVRNKKTPEAEIVIDGYDEDGYGLLEFLNVVSTGRIGALVVGLSGEE